MLTFYFRISSPPPLSLPTPVCYVCVCLLFSRNTSCWKVNICLSIRSKRQREKGGLGIKLESEDVTEIITILCTRCVGYYEFLTNRALMVDMPTHLGRLNKVPLDGVVSS